MRPLMLLVSAILVLIPHLAFTQSRPVLQDAEAQAAWLEDLQVAVQRMESIHPNLFWMTSESDFQAQVDSLAAEIPYLTDNQIVMGFARIAAHGGGHTYLWMLQEATGFRLYPLRLYWFSDGLYALRAQDPDVVGARLVQVGNASVDEVFEQFTPMISYDNEMAYLLWSPLYYVMPELLEGIGVISDVEQPNFVFEDENGEQIIYNPSPMSVSQYNNWNNGYYVGLPQRSEPLYLSNMDENFWYEYLDDSQTLYIQYNAVQGSTQSGQSLSAFSREIADVIENEAVQRVVVDVRHNGGGNNNTYPPLLSVLRNEAVNQPGRLFVITGRYTFSAAMNFASDMEQRTEALFVGEPTGSRPNHYGDSVPFTLPNSGLTVNVSPEYLQDSTPDDTRPWIEPDIPAPLTSDDFFSGRDPALEAILNYEG